MPLKVIYIFLISAFTIPYGWGQMIFFSGNDDNSIFICEDGRVFMSGENNTGQLGNGSLVPSFYPVPLAGIDGIGVAPKCKQVQIEGVSTFLALTNSGDTVLAWGPNNFGQTGDGSTTMKTFPVRVKGVGGVGYLQNIKQIATSNTTAYGLTEDGKVVAWGDNLYGQVGMGTTGGTSPYPSYVLKAPGDTLKNVKALSAGGVTCYALLCDESVWAWGRNNIGQLGQGNLNNSAYAVRVKNSAGTGFLSKIKKIEAGDNYCFALSSTDTVWSWGSGYYRALGTGNITSQPLPAYVKNSTGTASLKGVTAIAAGQGHSLFLMADKTVLACGENYSGQVGTNDTVDVTYPVPVKSPSGNGVLSDINYIGTGDRFSIARTSDNKLYVWGDNSLGQLGVGDHVDRWLPVLIPLLCQPTSDQLPGFGRLNYTTSACTGGNSGTIFLNRAHLSVSGWQESTDNFSSLTKVNNTNYALSYSDLSAKTYYRAVLNECGVNYFSTVATIDIDSITRPGRVDSSATVRTQLNKDTLKLKGNNGRVLQWEYSADNFLSDIHTIYDTTANFVYSGILHNTYYRALVQSGTCPAAYSKVAEIKVIDNAAIKVYNGFSPDGDLVNDEWVIDYIELFPSNKVEIYNRWGQLIYRSSPYDNEKNIWKGENNILDGQPVADGTYFYVVDPGEGYPVLKGFVVVGR